MLSVVRATVRRIGFLSLTILAAGVLQASESGDTASSAPRLAVQLSHNNNQVTVAAFSADQHLLLTGGFNGDLVVWDVASGKTIHNLRGHSRTISAVAFSADGGRFASSADDDMVQIWETATGKALCSLSSKPGGPLSAVGFSPDGSRLLGINSWEVLEWNAATGERIRTVPVRGTLRAAYAGRSQTIWSVNLEGQVRGWGAMAGAPLADLPVPKGSSVSLACSADGRRVLVSVVPKPGSKDPYHVELFDVGALKPIQRFDVGRATVKAVDLSADGRQVAIGVVEGVKDSVLVFDAESGERVAIIKLDAPPAGVCFGSSGRQLLILDAGASLWALPAGTFVRRLESKTRSITNLFLLGNGKSMVVSDGRRARFIWDMATGQPTYTALEVRGDFHAFDYDPGTDQLLVPVRKDDAIRVVRAAPRLQVGEVTFPPPARSLFAHFAPDGKGVLLADEKTVRLWDAATGNLQAELPHTCAGRPKLLRGRDRKHFFLHIERSVAVWSTNPLREVGRLEGFVGGLTQADIWDDGATIGTIALGGDKSLFEKVQLWDGRTGKLKRELTTKGPLSSFAVSADGSTLAAGGHAGAVTIWRLTAKDDERSFVAHQGGVYALAFSPDGRRLFSGGPDGTLRLWDVVSGEQQAVVTHMLDGSWVVFTPDGRFDTNNPEVIDGVHWIVPDEPLRPLPPEIFLRDYYEPRLLARVLAGESFKAIRSLSDLNRVQPTVEVKKVEAQPGSPDEVTVTVEVADQSATVMREGKKLTMNSGVFDVHLFRDGQLVGLRASADGAIPLDPTSGRALLAFPNIRLPRKAGLKEVEFSAYAFNADRVKSPTRRIKHALPAGLAPRRGVAYVICVGVNAFDTPTWDLRFAVPDAKAIAQALGERLERSGQFERVVVVPLLSDARGDKETRKFTQNAAVKENIRAVLALLAGEKVDAARLKDAPAAAAIQPARPEDLVVLSFSTHGYNSHDGLFYLFPSDIGPDQERVSDELLKRAVSTDELSHWLRGVDAGEMVMIVDACHSAGSVESEGFKPGPMGSRGLGQLAYNKRMRILAASQAADVAFEDARIGHGLLTYALCNDGLKDARADFAPADKRIMLGEWLKFGVARVPQLAEEIASGKLSAVSASGRNLRVGEAERGLIFGRGRRSIAQQPSLFDFTRGSDGVLLSTR